MNNKERILKHLNYHYELIENIAFSINSHISREQQIKLAGYKQAIIDIEEFRSPTKNDRCKDARVLLEIYLSGTPMKREEFLILKKLR